MFRKHYDTAQRALVDHLIDQSQLSGPTNAVVMSLIALVVWSSQPATLVICWLLVGYAVSLPRNAIFRFLRKTVDRDRFYPLAETTLVLVLFASGLYWGVSAWLYFDPNDLKVFAFVTLAIVAIPPSALPVFSALPHIWIVFSSTMMLLISAKLFAVGFWELGVLSLINLAGLTPLCMNLGKSIQRSITLDIRNSELLEEVELARQRAEQANKAKSQFMAAASHDLRQPLHAQGMLLEALSLRLKDTEHADLLHKTTLSNEALYALFNAQLEISQLDAGTVQVSVGHHRLLELCRNVTSELESSAHSKGLTLEVSGDECVGYTDPVFFGRILRNLVDNAIKYSEHGSIHIHLQQQEERITLCVSDNGIGIPKELQKNIFDEYYQVNNQARDRSKGIGLGLALVKRMCDRLGHRISVQSTPGEGSSFCVELDAGSTADITAPDQNLESPVSIEGLKLLIIDDDQAVLDAMTLMLQDWGCEPRGYTTIAQALQSIAENNFVADMLITDYRLGPNVTGLDAIDSVRKQLGVSLPAVIVSGDTDPDLLEKIHQQNYYMLHKPLKATQLKKVIRRLLQN